MKSTITLIFLSVLFFTTAQNDTLSITKEDFIGAWRTCGAVDIDETADTLEFQHPTPNCRDQDCSEHNWSFRETGSVDFIFTTGCSNGFNSKSKPSKRWLFIEKKNLLKLITNDGWVEYFEVLRLDEKLVLVHRFDLEN
tara:strand:- start:54858 stop:55274 length:417 start_codon:yes stop_codon:yes gene_type:complete